MKVVRALSRNVSVTVNKVTLSVISLSLSQLNDFRLIWLQERGGVFYVSCLKFPTAASGDVAASRNCFITAQALNN